MPFFSLNEIDDVTRAFFEGFGRDAAWERYRHTTLALPHWFVHGLDPHSPEYYDQQLRLWQAITGEERGYDPLLDEATVENTHDVIRHPGYYRWRHADAVKEAGDHLRAAGAILANSNLRPGQTALEYGAGYGLIALHLARMGVAVDTVDISPEFCAFVQAQADFYKVPLTPFNVGFGETPRDGHKYDLIYFFESFHHCSDLPGLLRDLRLRLMPGGRIILAGEPIHGTASDAIPYPWGLRLDAPTVAVIRRRGWFELGFTEQFILDLFARHGLSGRAMPGLSAFDRGYIFEGTARSIDLGTTAADHLLDDGWHSPDAGGRWTKARASISIDTRQDFEMIEVHASNHHTVEQPVTMRLGDQEVRNILKPGQKVIISINATNDADRLIIECNPIIPMEMNPSSSDGRALGLHVKQIDYIGG